MAGYVYHPSSVFNITVLNSVVSIMFILVTSWTLVFLAFTVIECAAVTKFPYFYQVSMSTASIIHIMVQIVLYLTVFRYTL